MEQGERVSCLAQRMFVFFNVRYPCHSLPVSATPPIGRLQAALLAWVTLRQFFCQRAINRDIWRDMTPDVEKTQEGGQPTNRGNERLTSHV